MKQIQKYQIHHLWIELIETRTIRKKAVIKIPMYLMSGIYLLFHMHISMYIFLRPYQIIGCYNIKSWPRYTNFWYNLPIIGRRSIPVLKFLVLNFWIKYTHYLIWSSNYWMQTSDYWSLSTIYLKILSAQFMVF